ncbi:MAG TPA: nuclear transport factor 2 family protein [Flavobacterium sp.]|uniref:YybH family protein n=1 Tax=unclassified Flavobacterium TaxID=196869 RepID=UPI0025C4B3DA|nr:MULTISPECIES: nuclear transport factor 2 family protein [unclassified Flavobacterium]HRE78030.1 nuclear transport factor 2 family protein [Flavobacterium sp.]
MKKMVKLIMVYGMIAFLSFSCKEKASEPVEEAPIAIDVEAIKSEIQELENMYADAANSSNVDAVMNYYADDIVSYPTDKLPISGKAALRESLAKDFEEGKDYKVSFEVKDIFPSSDGVQVVELGEFTVKDSTTTTIYHGHYMSLFEKRDGKYVCIRDMAASDMPRKK